MINLHYSNNPDDVEFLHSQLKAFNGVKVGYNDFSRVTFLAHDEKLNEPVGGLTALIYFNYLWLETFWLHEAIRGQDYGQKLLAMAEEEARARGCHYAFADTFSFQAPQFYQKQGYEIFGVLDGVAGEHSRYFLRKDL